jgi:hypothetical protein
MCIIVLAASIGTGRLYWYGPPLLVLGRLYWYRGVTVLLPGWVTWKLPSKIPSKILYVLLYVLYRISSSVLYVK